MKVAAALMRARAGAHRWLAPVVRAAAAPVAVRAALLACAALLALAWIAPRPIAPPLARS